MAPLSRTFASAFFFSKKASSSLKARKKIIFNFNFADCRWRRWWGRDKRVLKINLKTSVLSWAVRRENGAGWHSNRCQDKTVENKIRTSSYSFGPFFGAFNGLALPPSLPTPPFPTVTKNQGCASGHRRRVLRTPISENIYIYISQVLYIGLFFKKKS